MWQSVARPTYVHLHGSLNLPHHDLAVTAVRKREHVDQARTSLDGWIYVLPRLSGSRCESHTAASAIPLDQTVPEDRQTDGSRAENIRDKTSVLKWKKMRARTTTTLLSVELDLRMYPNPCKAHPT